MITNSESACARRTKTDFGLTPVVLCIAMALLLTIAAVALCGCSSGSVYEGRWVCCGVKSGTDSYNVEDLGLDGASLMTVDLKADGSVAMTAMGESKDTTGLTWSESATGITLATDVGSMEVAYSNDTGELTMDYLGQVVVLKKQ